MRRLASVCLAGSLVVVAAPGALSQSPSPEQAASPSAEPPFAPDSLTAVLPSEIAGEEFLVTSWPSSGLRAMIWPNGPDPLPGLLASFGREPGDMRFATATQDDSVLTIMAIRVDGIAGDRVADGLWQTMLDTAAADGATPPPELSIEPGVIAGEPVRVLRSIDSPGVWVWYSIGEVTFMVLAPGTEGDPDGLAPEVVAALRDSVVAAGTATAPTAPQRIVFDDAGLAVTIPADWTPYSGPFNGEGTRPEGFIGAFAAPVGFEVCMFESLSADGRISLGLVEAAISDGEPGPYTTSRVQTAVGEAIRATSSQPIPFMNTVIGRTVSYTFPWGNAFHRIECFEALDDGATSDEDWSHIVETLEFLNEPAPGMSTEDAQATREVLCSIVVPHPGSSADAGRAHRSIAPATLGQVRSEARRFFRRHGDEAGGFRSPGTMEANESVVKWFTGAVAQPRVDRQVSRMKSGSTRASGTEELMLMFGAVYGAFDDSDLRADARRVIDAAYRYGATSVGKDPQRTWRSMNETIDQLLERHFVEPCTPR